jgi:outer membrane biosynthesis protein TonB
MRRAISSVLFAITLFAVAVSAQNSALKILEQPKPELPQRHGTLDVQGTVTLKVEFMDIGEIGEVTVVKQLTGDLDQKAIAAVRKIKF